MKKIVGILAVVAMTASLFAADFAAAVQGYGDLFSISTEEGSKVQFLGWNDPWDREFAWYSTGIGASFTGDKAGLSFEIDGNNKAIDGVTVDVDVELELEKDPEGKVTGANATPKVNVSTTTTNRLLKIKNSKFWIQPLDMLKIQLGANTIELAKETIDYDGTVFTHGFEGWMFELKPVDGLTVQLGLETGAPTGWSTNYFIGSKNYWGDAPMGEILATVAYGADFGTVTALYDRAGDENTIAIDYAGNFGGVAVSPAFAYKTASKAMAADLFVTANAAGVGINVYGKFAKDGADADPAVTVNTKFTYGTSIGQASLQIKDANVLADAFAMMVKANLGFNCGSAGLDCGVQFDIADTVKISVPFQYNIHF